MRTAKLLLLVVGLLATIDLVCAKGKKKSDQVALQAPSDISSVDLKKIEQLKETRWGGTLLSLAGLHAKTSAGTIEKLIRALNALVNELESNAKTESKRFDQKSAINQVRGQEMQVKINEATAFIAQTKQKIQGTLIPRKKSAEFKVAQQQKLIKTKLREQSDVIRDRGNEEQGFQRRVGELQKAINSLDQVSLMLESLLKPDASMIQIKAASKQLKNLHETLASKHLAEMPMIDVLANLANSQNFGREDTVREVIKVVQDLRSKVAESLQKEESEEISSKSMSEGRLKTIENELTEAKNQLMEYSKLISDTDKQIQQAEENISTKTLDLDNMKKMQEEDKETWRKQTEIHQTVDADIMKQVEVIKECQELFKNKDFVNYLKTNIQ